MPRYIRAAAAAPLLVTVFGTAHASCGSAFCNVNTNWSLQGVWTQAGAHVDLRFEYIDQDQPMALPVYNSSWYAQAGTQLPLNYSNGYKPGNVFAVDLGYRYDVNDDLGLNLQLNYAYKSRDKGAEAEPEDSGGQTLSIAPGITYAISPTVQVYAFVSAPLYRYVNGVQLTANWSAAGGMSVQF